MTRRLSGASNKRPPQRDCVPIRNSRHTPVTKTLYPLRPFRHIYGDVPRGARQGAGRGAPPFALCETVMFGLFERLLKPTNLPEHPEPPPGLIGFYWHFARQAKGLFIGLFAAGFVVALLDS